jgi:hypothetical protein
VGSDIQPAEVVAAVGDTSVEVVLPEGGSRWQLCCSGGSVVLRVDPVGGPPDVDFTDEGDARPTARRSPHRLWAVLAGVTSNLIGAFGNQPGPLRQILTPNRMIRKRFRYSGKPRQRSWVSSCGLWEAPVQRCGQVFRGVEFSSGGGCLQVDEWVVTGLSRQREEM